MAFRRMNNYARVLRCRKHAPSQLPFSSEAELQLS